MTAFQRRRAREAAALRAPRVGPIGQRNAKAGLAIAFPVSTCKRSTSTCRHTCYACSGPIAFRDSVRKSVANQVLCERDPRVFARRVVAEFRWAARGHVVTYTSGGRGLRARLDCHFVRWNASGDLFPAARRAVLAIARAGVWVHVFTRDPREGARLRRAARRAGLPVLVLLSVDATSAADCFRWRGPVAALTSRAAPAPWARLDPGRTVAFPVDGGSDNVDTVPPAFRPGACPCDMGLRFYLGSCTKCFVQRTGCWRFA